MTNKYYVSMMYINTDKELLDMHYIMNYSENHKAENSKDIKKQLCDLVEYNYADNQDWINDQIKPKVKNIIDKVYVQYYDGRYIAEKFAEDKKGNIIGIIMAEAYKIKPSEALDFIKTVN